MSTRYCPTFSLLLHSQSKEFLSFTETEFTNLSQNLELNSDNNVRVFFSVICLSLIAIMHPYFRKRCWTYVIEIRQIPQLTFQSLTAWVTFHSPAVAISRFCYGLSVIYSYQLLFRLCQSSIFHASSKVFLAQLLSCFSTGVCCTISIGMQENCQFQGFNIFVDYLNRFNVTILMQHQVQYTSVESALLPTEIWIDLKEKSEEIISAGQLIYKSIFPPYHHIQTQYGICSLASCQAIRIFGFINQLTILSSFMLQLVLFLYYLLVEMQAI